MRIEIKEKGSFKAAFELRKLMKARGGYWIVNAVGAEGYVACKVGTSDGDRMERSGSDCIAGVYCASITLVELAEDLAAARAHYAKVYGEDVEETKGKPASVFVPTSAMVLELLTTGPKRFGEICDGLGKRRGVVRMALRQLREQGSVQAMSLTGGPWLMYAVAA